MRRRLMACGAGAVYLACFAVPVSGAAQPTRSSGAEARPAPTERALIDRYCVTCHNDRLETGGLSLETVDIDDVASHVDVWERVVRKLRNGSMPPQPRPRPDRVVAERLTTYLEAALDRAAVANPDPGRTATLPAAEPHRVSERDPRPACARDRRHRTVTARRCRLRVRQRHHREPVADVDGTLSGGRAHGSASWRSPASPLRSEAASSSCRLTGPRRSTSDGLPFGTRGGTVVTHTFPFDGEYEIQVRLQRNRNENVEGLTERHEVEITLDGERLDLLTIVPDRSNLVYQANAAYYSDAGIDNHLNVRLPVTAGPHAVGATFIKKNSALLESTRQPYLAHFQQRPSSAAAAGGPDHRGGRSLRCDRESARRPAVTVSSPVAPPPGLPPMPRSAPPRLSAH